MKTKLTLDDDQATAIVLSITLMGAMVKGDARVAQACVRMFKRYKKGIIMKACASVAEELEEHFNKIGEDIMNNTPHDQMEEILTDIAKKLEQQLGAKVQVVHAAEMMCPCPHCQAARKEREQGGEEDSLHA